MGRRGSNGNRRVPHLGGENRRRLRAVPALLHEPGGRACGPIPPREQDAHLPGRIRPVHDLGRDRILRLVALLLRAALLRLHSGAKARLRQAVAVAGADPLGAAAGEPRRQLLRLVVRLQAIRRPFRRQLDRGGRRRRRGPPAFTPAFARAAGGRLLLDGGARGDRRRNRV